MRVAEVFPTNSYPYHTYVDREDLHAEERLARALKSHGQPVLVIGPSKAGKNALVERVVGRSGYVRANCVLAKSPEQVWVQIAAGLGVRLDRVIERTHGDAQSLEGRVRGGFNIGIATAGSDVTATSDKTTSQLTRESYHAMDSSGIIEEVARTGKVLVIDEMQHLEERPRVDLMNQVKAASEAGVSTVMLVASHKAGEPLRGTDLQGRADRIELEYWPDDMLHRIAAKGFPLLNLEVDSAVVRRLVSESLGSPQLMQRLCQYVCYHHGIDARLATSRALTLRTEEINGILEDAAKTTDYGDLYSSLLAGPSETAREKYRFNDNAQGDIYELILRALAADPPRQAIPYSGLEQRIEEQLLDARSGPRSAKAPLRQMSSMASEWGAQQRPPKDPPIYWTAETIHLPDPYFLLYLRWAA